MKTIRVKEILDNSLPEAGWEKFRIYVFRDDNLALYVGKSEQNVIDRLEEHLGLTYRSESLVGKLVEDNAPLSYSWCIDLLTLDECLPFVRRRFPNAQGLDVRLAERATILEYSPALNCESNPNPRQLPAKYTAKRDARILAAFKKVSNVDK